MPKSASTNLINHLQGEATSLTTLWEIERTDGVFIRLTALDRDVVFEGNTFESVFGFERSAISNAEGLDTDTIDIETLLSADTISREEVLQGLYNFATVRVYAINFMAPEDGAIRLRRGTLGEVLLGASSRFRVEVHGLMEVYNNDIIEKTSATCRVNVGNPRCMVPIDVAEIERETLYEIGDYVRVATLPDSTSGMFENRVYECISSGTTSATQPAFDITVGASSADGGATFVAHQSFTRNGVVTEDGDRRQFVTAIDEPRAVDGWFSLGRIRFETGPNTGLEREIRSWTEADQRVVLFQNFPNPATIGDIFSIVPGCNRLRDTCRNKWVIPGSLDFSNGNVINMQAEPDLPGRDASIAYPIAE